MRAIELYNAWAPSGFVWSPWAKPTLFACLEANRTPTEVLPALLEDGFPSFGAGRHIAIVADLPRQRSVTAGLTLAQQGFRPVPIFNCAIGPSPVIGMTAVVDALMQATPVLQQFDLPSNAPPVFLLDSRRMKPDIPPKPGDFDNRYYIFPQDFPSAGFLKHQGVQRILVMKLHPESTIMADLIHVLLRWAEGGLTIERTNLSNLGEIAPLKVERPARYRSLWHRFLAICDLKRNSAGGFGGVIPQPSSGG